MSDTATNSPVKITATAIKQLERIREKESISEDHFLRVGVKGGGCSGFTYVLGFDTPTEKDDKFNIEGMNVIMEKGHGLYLLGMEIDWHEGLNNRGFVFNNPNATDTCGCGTSFNA